jgi:hypothetical protein
MSGSCCSAGGRAGRAEPPRFMVRSAAPWQTAVSSIADEQTDRLRGVAMTAKLDQAGIGPPSSHVPQVPAARWAHGLGLVRMAGVASYDSSWP